MKPSEEFLASAVRKELAVYASFVEWDVGEGASEPSEDVIDCLGRIERLIAEDKAAAVKAARIEGMEAIAQALASEGYRAASLAADNMIAEERAKP